MNKDTVRYYISKYNKARGVNKSSVHLYRNYFAKEWLLAGGDEVRLQQLMGWSSIIMVEHYAKMFCADLKRNYNEYNPLSNIKHKKGERITL